MAAGNKDVELVVRARNEATRVLNTVEKALTDVADAQRGIVKEGGSAQTMMERLGRAIGDFQRAAGGDPTKALTDGLGRAQQAMKTLEVEADKTTREIGELETRLKSAGQTTRDYQGQTERLHQTMKGTARELSRMQTAHSAEEAALRRAGNEVSRFATRQQTATQNIERSRERIAQTREEYGRLGRALVQIGPANRELVNEFNRTGRSLATAEKGLKRYQQALAEETASLERSTSAQARQATVVERSAAALARQRIAAAQARTAFSDNVKAIENAQRAEVRLTAERDRSLKSSAQQATAIRQVKAETESLTATQAQAEAALARLARSGALPVFQSFKQVQAAMVEARTASQQQIASTNALARSMAIVGPPTREQVVAFAAARTESTRLKAEYLALAQASTRLNAVMRQKPTDAGGLARQQQEAAAALARLRTAQETIRASNRAAVAENNRLAESYNRTGAAARSLGAAKRQAAQGSRELKTELDRLYGSGRQSLGLFQRIRGQVLGLTASYVGLFSAVQGVGNVVGAFRTLETAQNRLGAVFEQNLDKVNGEIDFLLRNSRRLGISFQTLADDYGKFAVAAAGSRFSQGAMRDTFIAIAEAGRVNKLTPDRMQLVFFALQQMISKTKVQAEELTRQLSESLPGATQIFANAFAEGNVAKLLKDMQDGNVMADEAGMLRVADEMNKKFGGQLEASLEATTTQIDRFFGLLFEGLLGVATRGTFIEKFTELLISMNEAMQSPEGVMTLARLSNILGGLSDVAKFAVGNVNLLLTTLLSIGGIRLIPLVMGLTNRFREFGATAALAGGAQMTTFKAGVASSSATVITFSGVLAACRTALMSAMTAAVAFGRGILTGSGAALTTLIARLRALPAALAATVSGFSAAAAGGAAFTATAGGLRVALIALRAAFMALWSTMGVGLLVVGASFFFADMATSADSSTEALVRSDDALRKTKDAYDAARRGGREWAEEMRRAGVTSSTLTTNIQRNTKAMEDAYASLDVAMGRSLGMSLGAARGGVNRLFGGKEAADQRDIINELVDSYREGNVGIELFNTALNNLSDNAANDYIKDLIETVRASVETIEAHKRAIEENSSAQSVLTGTAEAAERAAKDLGVALDESGKNALSAAETATKFEESLRSLQDMIPGLKGELDFKDQVAEIEALRRVLESLDLSTADRAIADAALGAATNQASVNRYRAQYAGETNRATAQQMEDIVRGAIVAAEKLGTSAEDILTAIGYETGGTFNPAQPGPITQWGQHRGLIQFGEPQAVQHNVSFTDGYDQVANSVVSYLKAAGYKPGMEFARLYAAINAGGTSDRHLGRTDENNGGAPGTVMEKVLSQDMRENRARAQALLAEYGDSAQRTNERQEQDEARRQERQNEYNESLNEELRLKGIAEANGGKLTREAFIEKEVQDEINKAKQAGVTLDEARLNTIRELAGLEYDRQNATREGKADTQEANRALEQANALYQQQSALVKGIEDARKQGDQGRVSTLESELVEVNERLREAIANARAMWEAIGGEEAAAKLTRLETLEQRLANQTAKIGVAQDAWAEMDKYISGQLTSSFDNLAKAIAEGEDAGEAMKNAFLQFASEFLRKIAQMIIEQATLNALQGFMGGSAGGGGVGGILGSVLGSVRHNGGMAGGAGVTRRVSPAWFANAARYHEGGLAGLKPGEVPAILMRNEEVLRRDDPRHILNGGAGGGGGGASPVTVVNTFDAGSFMAEALGSREGQQMLLNFVRANSGAFKGALG